MKRRRDLKYRNSQEYRNLSKEISKETNVSAGTFSVIVERNRSMRVMNRELAVGRNDIHTLGDANGNITTNKNKITDIYPKIPKVLNLAS